MEKEGEERMGKREEGLEKVEKRMGKGQWG